MSMRTNLQRNDRGAALVVVVLSMIAAGLVGTAILAMATSSRYERVQYGITNQAYYLAESGAAYVRARRESNIFYFPHFETNVLANSNLFVVTADPVSFIYTNAAGTVYEAWHVVGHSTGIARPGQTFESVQRVYFDMHEKGFAPSTGELFSDETRFNFDLWDLHNIDPSDIRVFDTGPSDGPAVNLVVDRPDFEGQISLNWTANKDVVDMASAWETHGGLGAGRLSYDAQLKLQTFENVPSLHYMMGISFRLRSNGEHYGLSFFRSMTNDGQKAIADANRPPWARDANMDENFQVLRGTNSYAVLWYRANSSAPLRLINSRRLLPEDDLFETDLYDGVYEITNYCTLLLQLDEVYTDGSYTNRENHIVAYMEPPSVNPVWPTFSATNAVWQENATHYLQPITWDQNSYSPASGTHTNVVDSRITSRDFGTLEPPEIGLHIFYDRNAANETFFRDFALRLEGFSSPHGGTEIQW